MAESQSKYALTIASIRQRPAGHADAPVSASPEPVRGKGRSPGKRSNPEWKLYSHYLKKQTQREVTTILRNEDNGRDLSDVLQELLEAWLARHKQQ